MRWKTFWLNYDSHFCFLLKEQLDFPSSKLLRGRMGDTDEQLLASSDSDGQHHKTVLILAEVQQGRNIFRQRM